MANALEKVVDMMAESFPRYVLEMENCRPIAILYSVNSRGSLRSWPLEMANMYENGRCWFGIRVKDRRDSSKECDEDRIVIQSLSWSCRLCFSSRDHDTVTVQKR